MYIERIQIEEGFLNGFDVTLRAGLNVLIGARGTGKTSLIELVRFCLDVPAYTPELTRRSRDHALSVLGSGQITLTLVDGSRRIIVTRSAIDALPRASGPYLPPIVLSQTEIETVGLQPGGRLRLIDGFLGDQRALVASEREAISAVRSLTAEANTIYQDVDQLRRQIAELPTIYEELLQLAPQEQQLADLSADAAIRSEQLNVITGSITTKGVAVTAMHRFQAGLSTWRSSLLTAQSGIMSNEAWPSAAGDDPLGQIRSRVAIAYTQVNELLDELAQIEAECSRLTEGFYSEKVAIEDSARQLRLEIDGLQSGAGEIIRRGQQLRERKAQLESLQGILAFRQATLAQAIQRRSVAFDNLAAIRAQRFQTRAKVTADLNQVLGPRIKLNVVRGGQNESFAAAISEALRGSGLKYNDIAATLAKRISPRELLEAVESDDYELIASCGNITSDRAARATIALKQADLAAIATVAVEDYVTLSLLDGADYKDIADLSTGQRCTVILPLVLRHTDRLLIVDQPEDHIDNAFIVDTLIRSVLARRADGQILFSTHNANIPVLGNAEFVVQLGSDGKRGFPIAAASLDTEAIIDAISMVMEGGADAFRRRAEFYGKSPQG
jgi:ABC-type lipoprotein export system ATPase subunit